MASRGTIEHALSLASADREVAIHGRRARMRCPSPDHVTRSAAEGGTGSFYVWLDGRWAGEGKCYGCGLTTTWPETVRLLGLPRWARFVSIAQGAPLAEADLARLTGSAAREDFMRGTMAWPSDHAWRGVPGRLVCALGGGMVPGKRGPTALRLPVDVRARRVGHIDCTLAKPRGDELGYVTSGGTWPKHALYPYDYVRARSPRVIVLVEGTRDPLITIRNGCASLATLGSDSWSERCVRLLLQASPACVVIMMDPDDAGERLRATAYHDLRPHVDTRCVVLPSRVEDTPRGPRRVKVCDPADLSKAQLERVLASVRVRHVRGEYVP